MGKKLIIIFVVLITSLAMTQAVAQERQLDSKEKIDRIIKKLSNLSYVQRKKASEDIKKAGDPLIESLLKMARKAETGEGAWRRIEWNQRKAAWSLGEIGSEKATDVLIDMLPDTTLNMWARIEAISALGRLKATKAEDPLISMLNDKGLNAQLRRSAARSLGDMPCEKSVPFMIEALNENVDLINMGVIYALGKIGTDEAVDGLLYAMEGTEGYVRVGIYQHLRKLKPEKEIDFLLMALDDSYWGAREDAVKVILEKDHGVTEHLVKILNDENTSKVARWEAIRILGHKNPGKNTALFIEALKDENWMIRNQAAVTLAKLKASTAVDPLINLLSDENSYTREEAAWILGEIKSEQAVDPLIQLLNDRDSGWMAAMSLGKIGSEKAVKPLARLLKEKDVQKRRAAAWALGKISSKKAADALRKALQDEDEEVRIRAQFALDKIGIK